MKTVKEWIKKVWRAPLCRTMRKRLKNKNFVILSSNCVGGTLLHDLGLRFDTPTVNLTIPQFAYFCENWKDYFALTPVLKAQTERPYPVFLLGDIEIFGVHYSSEQEFLEKWETRKNRFLQRVEEGAEIILFACDAQVKGSAEVERFLKLPYRKVLFSSKKYDFDECVWMSQYEGKDMVGDVNRYADVWGHREYEKSFDCVTFLNQ